MIDNFKHIPRNLSLSRKGRGIAYGISLTEMMMTCTIMSIIAIAGFVGFSESIRIQDAEGGADRIGYAIKEAKYFARAKGVKTSFNFPVNAKTFSVLANEQAISTQDRIDALSGNLPGDVRILANTCEGMEFNENGKLIDADGNNVYAECAITVGYSNGPKKTVIIGGGTGNVDFR